MYKVLLVLLSLLICSGCSQNPQNTDTKDDNKLQTSNETQKLDDKTTKTTEEPEISSKQETDEYVYCDNEKVGKFLNGRIYVKIYDEVVSFESDELNKDLVVCLNEIDYVKDEWNYAGISYNGLEISPRIYSPYGIYKAVETPEDNSKITFSCDGSLVKKANTEDVPNFYCETNSKDYLTQYEFQGASAYKITATGGEYYEGWGKVYIKKTPELNYFFFGKIPADYSESLASDLATPEEFKRLTQKSYLNEVLTKFSESPLLESWDKIVNTFKVEPDDFEI